MPPKECCICREDSLFRCPSCKLRYCSGECFKAHKAQCEAAAATASQESEHDVNVRVPVAPGSGSAGLEVDTEDDPYRVVLTPEQLHGLHTSPEVVQALRDTRLRKLLVAIDTAPDREAALERARLQDEHFRAFIDSMLGAVGYAEPVTSATVGSHAIPDGYKAYSFSG